MSTGPRANSARVYEYILAGETPGVPFTPADLQMAQIIVDRHPNTAQSMHLNHLFIQLAADAYRAAGIHRFLDIGAGLPTEGALHEWVEGDPVLYADHDPDSVAFGQELLADRPHLRYIHARLEEVGPILEQADQLFGGERLVGISIISTVHFVSDDDLQRSLQQLYDWAAPGSMLAITSTRGESSSDFALTKDEYKERTGLPVNLRTMEELAALAQTWQLVRIAPLEEQIEAHLGTRVVQDENRGFVGFGGLFRKL